MAVSKVVLGDETLIDLTSDTVSEDTLLKGATAHAANGEQITGGVVVTPMYTGTKAAIEEAIALGQIPEDAVVNITDDEEASSFQAQINEINSSLSRIVEIGTTTINVSKGDAVIPYSGDGTKIFITTRTRHITNVGYPFIINAIKQSDGFKVVVLALDSKNAFKANPTGTIEVDYIICK